MPYKSKVRPNYSRRFLLPLILVVLLALVAGGLGISYLIHRSSIVHTSASQATKGEHSSSNAQQGSSQQKDSTPNQSASSSTSGAVSTQPLIVPTGNFVSNHHPNLSGSPAPNLMASDCTTTPGATCQISFTQNGVTKYLPAETTDAGGSAYWNWKLQDIGLTVGSWKIEAIARLGNQTKTATDALLLEVSQ